jgi:Uma2 family endonuclease
MSGNSPYSAGETMVTTPRLFSLADYLDYDDGTDRRYELVNGELREMPSESDLNNAIAIFLLLQFGQKIPGKRLRRGTEVAVMGKRATVRVPDLLVLSEELEAALAGAKRSIVMMDMPPPVLAVEIVSPGKENEDRDYRYKRSEYGARGIAEYWIIDPSQGQITVLTLVDGLYEAAIFRDSDTKGTGPARLVSRTFPTLELTVQQILSCGEAG